MNRRAAAWRLVGVGWYVGLCIAGGVFIGRWLDGKFNTAPILVIIGLVLGSVLAFFGVYHMLTSDNNGQNNKESK
jgi:F0F1-type ATP synthase assembly protein I